jgi:hypothetical protein
MLLLLSVGVGGGGGPKTGDAKRAGDRNVDRQALTATPHRESNIPRAAPRSGTQDTFLFEPGVQETLLTHLLDKVTDTVVPNDNVSIPTAATGVIAESVKGLLAERAGEDARNNRVTKAVGHGCPKNPGAHNRVVPVLTRRDGRHESAGVWLEKTDESLALANLRALHQTVVDGLV